jgi:hypothetical protein
LFSADSGGRYDRDFAEVPILAEEAVEGAAGIEDGKVVITQLLAAAAHPIRHAVGWQGITTPLQYAAPRDTSQVSQTTVAYRAQPTVSVLTLGHAALPATQNTLEAADSLWSCSRKIEGSPALGVEQLRKAEGFIRMSTDAVEAKAEGFTGRMGGNTADPAASVTPT